MLKPEILVLCQRVPFPPDKGDKIRSYYLIRHLSKRFSVRLGAFADDPDDLKHVAELSKICTECKIIPLDPRLARLRYFGALLRGLPLTVAHHTDSSMQKWVNSHLNSGKLHSSIVVSSGMAQYLLAEPTENVPRVLDFVDIDSDKWRQYSENSRWPIASVYAREARRLAKYEKKICGVFDLSLFVSVTEANVFTSMLPEFGGKIDYFDNGVNTQYFDSKQPTKNPYAQDSLNVVFTGAMDYKPNEDAVSWFSQFVFPELLKSDARWRFYIVGSKPSKAVQQLSDQPGVLVTGRVPDVRPFLAHAVAAVAPMRLARGTQNKVLEAMAMGLPTVVSEQAAQGISAINGQDFFIAKSAKEYTRCIEGLASGASTDMGTAARLFVSQNFSWQKNLTRLDSLIDGLKATEK